tara:strand:- start:964 stop:1233 length:270 start_codon:yes stop_codon:yes gene_type:complete
MNEKLVEAIVSSVLSNYDCEALIQDKSKRIREGLVPNHIISELENLSADIRKATSKKGRLPNSYLYYWARFIDRITDLVESSTITLPSE